MPPRPSLPPLLGADTEGTGLDTFHGARPYFITTCDEDFNQVFWEFDIEPYTRDPIISESDLLAVRNFLKGKRLVFQNTKYDYHALKETPGLDLLEWWDWSLIYDTLQAAHLLGSNKPKDLTTLALMELGVDISPYEKALEEATQEAVKIVKDRFPRWRRARRGLSDMPSAKEKVWKFDAWLPRRVAQELGYDSDHPWWTVLSDYGNADSATVLQVFLRQREKIKERGYWKIYLEKLRVIPIAADMEDHGITVYEPRFRELEKKYKEESERAGRICKNIAWGYDYTDPETGETAPYDLKLPKSGKNKSLETFVFDVMKLPVVGYTEKGFPALNKPALEVYQETLDPRSAGFHFIRTLGAKRKRDTNLSYMEGYERFWIPAFPGAVDAESGAGWYVLHPSLNPTGTDTLRWSSSNPNEQNISKQGSICMSCYGEGCEDCDGKGIDPRSLRYLFGPAPGREWWSLDSQNIELRIPSYESGETELIGLFEKPDEPPYYGSVHLLNFSTVYPDIWNAELKTVGFDKVGPTCKKKYVATWYQWCKNGGFGVQYGAMYRPDGWGTADKAFHKKGAHGLLLARFQKQEKLNQKMIRYAEEHGYVETLPDRTVDPERGYPLLCTRTEHGRILPTVPLNYHVQSTAMWVMMRMMIKTKEYLNELNARGERHALVMQIHDEIVLDFPFAPNKGNLPKIRELKRRLDSIGYDLIPSIPLPVGIEYHPDNWSVGETCK